MTNPLGSKALKQAEKCFESLDTKLKEDYGFNPHNGIFRRAARIGRKYGAAAVNFVINKEDEFNRRSISNNNRETN